MTLDVNRSSQVLKGSTYAYNYDNGDKLTLITSGSSTVKSYGYDAAGRTHTVTTSAGTTTLSYDYEDRVTGISYPSSATNSLTYNGLDTRVGKVDSTGCGISTYKRDGADVTDPVLSDGSIAYTPGVSERKSGTSTFDHGNYIGTYTRQTNASQTTTATRVYDAFGNLESTTGSPQSAFGFVGGEGYQEDSNSGLKILGHRYYDPSTGRFLTRDGTRDGRNWYVYCDSNPVEEIDSTGDQAEHTKGARPSTKDGHQKGQSRLGRDAGVEKGDRGRFPKKVKGEKTQDPDGSKKRAREIADEIADEIDANNPSPVDGTPVLDWIFNNLYPIVSKIPRSALPGPIWPLKWW